MAAACARSSGEPPGLAFCPGRYRIELPRLRIDGQASLCRVLPHHPAKLNAQQEWSTLGALTRLQQSRLSDLPRRMAAKFQFAGTVISLRRAGGVEAIKAVETEAGQPNGDELQMLIADMENEEQRLMVQRMACAKEQLKDTREFLILGTVLGMLIAMLHRSPRSTPTIRRSRLARSSPRGCSSPALVAATFFGFSHPAFPSVFPPVPPALPSYPAALGPVTSPASLSVHSRIVMLLRGRSLYPLRLHHRVWVDHC
jgi:hypothetical protein